MNPTRRKNNLATKHKKSPEEIYYPIPQDFNPIKTDRESLGRLFVGL